MKAKMRQQRMATRQLKWEQRIFLLFVVVHLLYSEIRVCARYSYCILQCCFGECCCCCWLSETRFAASLESQLINKANEINWSSVFGLLFMFILFGRSEYLLNWKCFCCFLFAAVLSHFLCVDVYKWLCSD